MIEKGTKVTVKRGYGTACDMMTGVVIEIKGDQATVFFSSDGDVDLPIDSLVEV